MSTFILLEELKTTLVQVWYRFGALTIATVNAIISVAKSQDVGRKKRWLRKRETGSGVTEYQAG